MDDCSRSIIVAANWKMYKNREDALDFIVELLAEKLDQSVEVIICPPSLLLSTVAGALEGTNIKTGAQNIHWEKEGAYTGEISAPMVKDAGCAYCLCGHSERRHYFEESSEMVTRKAQSALNNGLRPIICIGETLEERENGETKEILRGELLASLAGIIDPTDEIVVAYEPVWAIGTGQVAHPEDAEVSIAYIRELLYEHWGEVANKISILYGGSVKPDNIKELMACPNIDGVLVGGASLKAGSFIELINYKE